ncbi:glycosyltransferase family 4 protein [Gracilibacillus alcaliphilus]|uniref:glycosyltransferase family 4 protein n=1 Tax=Gracilibacillus alcaliphilus TaxID=1401441 RepID=UPI00195BF71D|nr:MraY family glycosyltransferase [Gracilibacillus alcaliphilus]MBM7678432.1 UDP-GlcNAc:undecaprenyl-phosphate GlcNAc-1-phosphate transferase [Gracilibacillus alcaliphilus]
MYNIMELITAFLISAGVAFLTTPLIKKLAIKVGAVDYPTGRKKHKGVKARLGGLSIVLGVAAGLLFLQPEHPYMTQIIIGGVIVVITGILDDIFGLKPYQKLLGQLIAALVLVSSGLIIDKITMPFFGTIDISSIGLVLTVLWVIGVTNAINLIDGLDGLAAGVSAIGLTSILIIAIMDYRLVVVYLGMVLVGSCLGFLYHNFYPAKIFMGDTGALFLGYSISVISMLGLFKNVALFSFIIPIIIIAVPIFDTIFAIVRRLINKQNIGMADRKHIHYQLIDMGYSHQTAVLIIYAFSGFFGLMAIIFNSATLLASLFILGIIVVAIQLIAELSGVVINGQKPLINSVRKLFGRKQKI